MNNLSTTALKTSINNLIRRKKDMDKYASIMKHYRNVDISSDKSFQRSFTSFYRVRRNAEWRKVYFDLFEAQKKNVNVSFDFILRSIFASTGRIEASFASKMLATIKPDYPIWDSIVLSKLHLKTPAKTNKESRLEQTTELYAAITLWYNKFLTRPESEEYVRAFDAAFPEFLDFSKTKKIDFLIWASGDADLIKGRR